VFHDGICFSLAQENRSKPHSQCYSILLGNMATWVLQHAQKIKVEEAAVSRVEFGQILASPNTHQTPKFERNGITLQQRRVFCHQEKKTHPGRTAFVNIFPRSIFHVTLTTSLNSN